MKKLKNFALKPFYFALCLIFGLFSFTISAAENQPTTYSATELGEFAERYLMELFPPPAEGKTEYHAVPLDKRIKIKPCFKPLQISVPGNAKLSKQTTVLLRCPDSAAWNLYVQVKILQMIPVVVSRTNLAPGTVVTEDLLTTKMVDMSQIRGRTLRSPNPLFGGKINRFVSAGQAVTMRHVCLVCKGDNVTVVAKLKGLSVKTSGISQQSGSLGDNIAIINQRTNKRIKARVVAVNQVEINL